ncbi:MAG: RidA family protein [Devosia sp.]|jgi:enamine deaminase RidA (YjgF/YER057c/UK114 family)|nr:RidA family protein [Alphaproteobacteria bacterium]MBU1560328.1 RidA family protein [Alphaproteobacteria bacterium]MBU2303653.1 RidA family protein [Alphaproteobacteria bacterium]MBU2366252.1 RidA family protein [Alphaproteobacteria bacterium]
MNPIARINPTTLPDAASAGYAQISVVPPGPLAFVSGQVAWRRMGGAKPGTLSEQTDTVIENLSAALEALAARPSDIVQLRIYLTDLRAETQDIVMGKLAAFLDGTLPSLTGVGVVNLAAPDLQIEIEMVVRIPD